MGLLFAINSLVNYMSHVTKYPNVSEADCLDIVVPVRCSLGAMHQPVKLSYVICLLNLWVELKKEKRMRCRCQSQQ